MYESDTSTSQHEESIASAQPTPQLTAGVFVLHERNGAFVEGTRASTRFNGENAGLDVLLCLVGVIVVIGLGLVLATYAAREQHFEQASQTALALVSDQHDTREAYTDSRGRRQTNTVHHITYEYVVDGQAYTRRESYDQFDLFRPQWSDGKLVIRYLPDDPAHARMASPPAGGARWGVIILVVAVLLTPELFIFWKYWRNRRLEKYGRLLDGTIIHSTGEYRKYFKQSASGGNWWIVLDYVFTTPDGHELHRHDSEMRNDLAGMFPPEGTAVKVMYLNDRFCKIV